eukprot:COSAG02_NODE_6228_length_3712_cov_2.222530_3_plen_261_part_00
MAAGNNRRNDDDEAWRPGQKLTSEKDSRGLPDSGRRKILHMVDLYSNYSFLYGSAKVDQDSAIAGTKAFIDAIRERYGNGEWPNDGAVIYSDMGKEYGQKFQDEITAFEPKIRLQRQPPSNVNADAVVEQGNQMVRRYAKKLAENMKSKRTGSSKSYLSYWMGQKGEILAEINSLLNTRAVSSLGWQSPADIVEAYFAQPQTDEDRDVLTKASAAKQSTAKGRRAAYIITPFKKGQKVRRISSSYMKAHGKKGSAERPGV